MTEKMEEVKIEQNGTDEKIQKPKKQRKPFSKRVKNVVLSPLHLFQKYVLRRKRHTKSIKAAEGSDSNFNETLKVAAIDSAKRRKLPCYFLFLGLSKSGKSTTISKLFNGERPKLPSRSDLIKIYQNTAVGDGVGLKVVDTPGFLGEIDDEEHDSQTLLALSSFLQQDLPNKIPTATFLVVKLEKEVDIKFVQMLKMLSLLKSITDHQHSNLILLFTHSQKLEDKYSESQIAKIIEKYQNAVANTFSGTKKSLPVILIENFRHSKGKSAKKSAKRYHDIVFEGLQKFAKKRVDYPLNELVNWLTTTSKRFSIPLKKEIYPVTRYVPYDDKEYIKSLMSRLSGNGFSQMESQYKPYFVLYDSEQDDGNDQTTKKAVLLTCIPAGSQIVLADKKVIKVEDCLVGDKLLTLDLSNPSVIVKIVQVNSEEMKDGVLGTIYCSVEKKKSEDENDRRSERLVYKYENKAFAVVDVMKANIPMRASSNSLYFLEVDSKDGTFVMNGFPCFVQCDSKTVM